MIIQFKTKSGSVYELDQENKVCRRTGGKRPPTSRQGEDGTWQRYEVTSDVVVGAPFFVDWNGDGKGTITSQVTEIL